MKISLFRGGFATLYSSETIETWDEFVDLVARPVIGIKNGDYFVRGYCDGPRCDASITHPEMISSTETNLKTTALPAALLSPSMPQWSMPE